MKRIILILFIFIFGNCQDNWKRQLVSHGNYNDMIKNAIIDFVNTNKLSNYYYAFAVNFGTFSKNMYFVEIKRFDPNEKIKLKEIYSNSKNVPTNYFIYKNRIFYWRDTTTLIDTETINIFKKYNLIDTNLTENDEIEKYIVYYNTDIKTYYFFCKCDFKKYTTYENVSIIRHLPINLNCNCK